MEETTVYVGVEELQCIEWNDADGDQVRVANRGETLLLDICVLDREQVTALVERLQLWLATGSLHKGEGK